MALFSYYLLVAGGHHYSIDGIVVFQSAKALLFRGLLILEPPVLWGRQSFDASPFGIGMTLAYTPLLVSWLPLFLVAPRLQDVPYDPNLAYNPALYANLPYLLCSLLNPTITALTAFLLFRLCLSSGLSRAWAVLGALVYGAASPAVVYARFDFAQPLAGLLLTGGVLALVDERGSSRAKSFVLSGAWLGAAVLTRIEFVALGAWIAGWLAWRARREGFSRVLGRLVVFSIPLAAGLFGALGLNWVKFGSLLTNPSYGGFVLRPNLPLDGLRGLLLSPGRGILFFFPLSLLAVVGFRSIGNGKRRGGEGLACLVAGLVALGLLLYGSFPIWWGGWCWGPRFLVPFLPLVVLAATSWAAHGGAPARRRLFAAFGAVGFLLTFNGILFDFNEFFRTLGERGIEQDSSSTQYLFAASPIFAGWFSPAKGGIDLLLARMADAEQIRRLAPLSGLDPEGAGPALIRLVSLGSLFVAGLLVLAILWSCYQIFGTLRVARREQRSA